MSADSSPSLDVVVRPDHLSAAALAMFAVGDVDDALEVVAIAGRSLADALPMATLVAQLTHPRVKVWSAKVTGVEKAKANDGSPINKAVVFYESPPKWTDDPGEIATGWLNDSPNKVAAGVAAVNVGEYCTMYQLNEPAPEGHQASSFRRLVWVTGPNAYVPPSKRNRSEEAPS